jgi:hypothetical protein
VFPVSRWPRWGILRLELEGAGVSHFNVNESLAKAFSVTDQFRVVFRAEAIDVFNRWCFAAR